MTAPAAPVIRVRTNGTTIRVLWKAVDEATDYKLYAGNSASPSGVEADIADDEVGDDGYFQWTFIPDDMVTYVNVTALNALAEESADSNEVRVHFT